MKRKGWKISIIMFLISFCAYGFVCFNHDMPSVYAATREECNSLLKSDGTIYETDESVGTIEGLGNFIIGQNNVELTATANSNYQLVGWNVVYDEQDGKTEFIEPSDLDANNQVELTDNDGEVVKATLVFNKTGNYATSGKFVLSTVFEDLTISPVFAHIYYMVEVDDLATISSLPYNKDIVSDVLYYESQTDEDGELTYHNSYIKIDNKFYFYGDVKNVDGNYYTVHQTIEASPRDEYVDYKVGAFRAGDEVNIAYDVDIDEDNIMSSTNIDIRNISIGNRSLEIFDETKTQDEFYKIVKDNYSRSAQYEIKFNIKSDNTYINIVNMDYHVLYVVDLVYMVDGAVKPSELADILGDYDESATQIIGNVSLYNFYSKVKEDCTQFLVKTSSENNARSFGVNCLDSVKVTFEGDENVYSYYSFNTLDGVGNKVKYYSNITNNFVVTINYLSLDYNIDFECVEYVAGNSTLLPMEGNALSSTTLKRKGTIELDATDVESVVNVGYKFVGFAFDYSDEKQATISYTVDSQKPLGTTILLCYEKIEYEITLTNYNSINIGGVYPIKSILFVTTHNGLKTPQDFDASDLAVSSEVKLNKKMKLNDELTIKTDFNAGFNVMGYGLKNPNDNDILEEDCLTSFTLDAEFISNNNLTENITLYVYEDVIKYTLTYYIDERKDTNLGESGENVIMADISSTTSSLGATITRYDINDEEIAADDTTTIVAKIVVRGLNYNDEVVLLSSGRSQIVGETSYVYSFDWYALDNDSNGNKTILSYTENDGVYSRTEKITKSRTIQVVYSLPSTKLLIGLDEEFAELDSFTYSVSVVQNNNSINMDSNITNLFYVDVGAVITISLKGINYGYKYDGYKLFGSDVSVVNGVIAYEENSQGLYKQAGSGNYVYAETSYEGQLYEQVVSFTFTPEAGNNNIVLQFSRIPYNFYFAQYGAGYDGAFVKFGANDYATLTVDSTVLTFTKPEGCYVAGVALGGFNGWSTKLSENNNFKNNSDIINYDFALTREQFIEAIRNYSEAGSTVDITIDYLIFTYDVIMQYQMTASKGSAKDSNIRFPEVKIAYNNGEEDIVITKTSAQTIKFEQIPYGANARIDIVGSVPLGLSVSGWYDEVGSLLDTGLYEYSPTHLVVGSVKDDKIFTFKLNYDQFSLKIQFDKNQGNPSIYLNEAIIEDNPLQITLFDDLKIYANASRVAGYTFDCFSYKVPVYTEYVYDLVSWDEKHASLYYLKDGYYFKNTSDVYNPELAYYTLGEEEVIYNESNILEVNMFNIGDYIVDGSKIEFYIRYKEIQLYITNTYYEIAESPVWSLNGAGNGDAKLAIPLDQFAIITIYATNIDGVERTIGINDTVGFHESIKIIVEINKNAINGTLNNYYDLTKGLILSNVQIGSKTYNLTPSTTGVYTITFGAGEYMPATGEDILISYTFAIQKKIVNLTTIIKGENAGYITEFYNNISMFINANTYGFAMSAVNSINTTDISLGLQFLSTVKVYATFLNNDYNSCFEITNAKIYCDGVEVLPAQYQDYGITIVNKGENQNFEIISVLSYNLNVVFDVKPIIKFKEDTAKFSSVFKCNSNGEGIEQALTVGSTSADDIQVADMIKNLVVVQYYVDGAEVDSVVNCGVYVVGMYFKKSSVFDWLEQIDIVGEITFEITPKSITLDYDRDKVAANQQEKVYDRQSGYNMENVYNYLRFVDNDSLVIEYEQIRNSTNNNLTLNGAEAFLTTSGEGGKTTQADEDDYYNVYIYNFSLKDTLFNRNFNLVNNVLEIRDMVKINRREIQLDGLYVYDKVYDGTVEAKLGPIDNVRILNSVLGDDITINEEKIAVVFDSEKIGVNKSVTINTSSSIVGEDANNYFINPIMVAGLTIYPHSVETFVEGYGKVALINNRGLTEMDKVSLIPLNATLRVEAIVPDSAEYAAIHSKISQYVRGNNEFVIAYKLVMVVGGEKVDIDRNLHLSIPGVANSTGVYFLTGQQAGKVESSSGDGNIIVDLKQMNVNVEMFFVTQKKVLLKPWQIALIITSSVLLVGAVTLTFVLIRRRKIRDYNVHEKI